jgi:hypothetical protein
MSSTDACTNSGESVIDVDELRSMVEGYASMACSGYKRTL